MTKAQIAIAFGLLFMVLQIQNSHAYSILKRKHNEYIGKARANPELYFKSGKEKISYPQTKINIDFVVDFCGELCSYRKLGKDCFETCLRYSKWYHDVYQKENNNSS